MKAILVTVLFMGFMTANAASAAQQISHADGKEKIGVVSASNAYTLDNLADELSRKADEKGASAYKILSATGKNRLHGVAEIYQ
ncbi:MAG TPA: multiple stress resistance protein BhsA [Leclercia sp.]|nr:multiple stress resistance protein BhsA [Leclercia sp.]